MPSYSPPYIYYAGKVIPELIKSYIQRCWQTSPEMAEFYLTVITCLPCAVGLRGYWRHQVNFIMNRVLDEITSSSDPGVMVTVALNLSPEHRPREWTSVIREDFRNPAQDCQVINEMLQMNIIQMKNQASPGGTDQIRRPTIRGGIEVGRHACELLENCSHYYEWTSSFRASVEGRLEE